ncbi:MAG: family 20 glycosylhydrolase, partial [Balneolaceae bacterium]|nr:family 20 glycosylhydrolase [Balneolaceae bacterium]
MNALLVCFLASAYLLTGCQQKTASVTEQVAVTWELLDNEMGPENDRYRAALTLENRGETALPGDGWALFFNFRHHIDETRTSGIADITFINGDFYRLSPVAPFELTPGVSVTIQYEGRGDIIKNDRAPQGLYFVTYEEQGMQADTTVVTDYTARPITNEQVLPVLSSVPRAESRFAENTGVTNRAREKVPPVLPTPRGVEYTGGSVILDAGIRIHHDAGLQGEAEYLAERVNGLLNAGVETAQGSGDGAGIISLTLDEQVPADAVSGSYQLQISRENGISITAGDSTGVFYGIQSLLALVPPESYSTPKSEINIPALVMDDRPRFPYRGMHLDVSRNFNDKQAVFKTLDLMAFYKLNKLHFHLTDDEGWRLQIEELPELTEVGAHRGHTLTDERHLQPAYGSGPYPDPDSSYGSGFYTRADYKEILRYAHERHIEVIPEFDVPGHARAAIKAMEARYRRLAAEDRPMEAEAYRLVDPEDQSVYLSAQEFNDNVICVCRESAYRFFETVVDDVAEMHEEAGVPLNTIHMGGDEVPQGAWEQSPMCTEFIRQHSAVEGVGDLPNYFVGRLAELLDGRDLTLAGWQEIALQGGGHGESGVDPSFSGNRVTIYSWDNFTAGNRDLGYRVANAGFPVVLSNATNLYFELAYSGDPTEPGDYFAGFVDTRRAFEFMPMNFNDPLHETGTDGESAFVELEPSAEQNILGMQGHLWSEPIKGPDSLEYFYAPKILGLAERAWSDRPSWETMP